jgi:hypothetical protein
MVLFLSCVSFFRPAGGKKDTRKLKMAGKRKC